MDLYSTESLTAVVRELRLPPSFLLDTYCPGVIEHETEAFNIDVEVKKNRITPLVHPTRAGKVVQNRGFTTKTFKPAYAKDLRFFEPNSALKRIMGEKIGGSMSPAERMRANLGLAMTDQLEMLQTREEVMFAEFLRTGKITVSGEGYDTVVVDFLRDAALTVTLTSNDRWSVDHADSDPLTDLENWSTLIGDKSGGTGRKVTMHPTAWEKFRTRLRQRGDAQVLLDMARASRSTAELGPMAARPDGVMFKGVIGDFEIWTYSGTYIDDAGNTQKFIADNQVVMSDESLEASRNYGMIQDEEADLKATRFFVKSWLKKNPGKRVLLLQSAPLPVAYRPNASLCATVA